MIIPKDILHIILEYDGRIKYIHKKGIYVDIISKNDVRYTILQPVINKKINIMKKIGKSKDVFFFDIPFENIQQTGLIYYYNSLYCHFFEICFYNYKRNYVERTYI